MRNTRNEGMLKITGKIPLIQRLLLKAESKTHNVPMQVIIDEVLTNPDLSCTRYNAPTFDTDSPDCYLSTSIPTDILLGFKQIAKDHGMYYKIFLRNLLRKRYQ